MSLRVVAGLLFREGKVLACQRREEAVFPLKWEFPGGKVEEAETDLAALQRELREELAIEVRSATEVLRYTYQYPNWKEVELIFFRVQTYHGEIDNLAFESLAWVRSDQLGSLDFLDGDKTIVEKLGNREIDY
ncbi:MAG: (deoxy)nucleoside triphosphate pyrophosphohydrolase [Candidatus Binatia bacterium]